MRDWSAPMGYEVSDRGRIAVSVGEAYEAGQ